MNLYLRYKDKTLRKNILLKKNLFFLYKALLSNQKLDIKYRFKIMQKIQNYNKISHIKNRCILNNNSRGVQRLTGLSKYY